MSFKGFSIFSPGDHLVQRSGTIWAILVEGHPTIIPVKFCQNRPSGSGGDVVLKFFSIFSPGGHIVQRSGTIWANLVEGQPTIIPVKFHQNRPSGYGGDVV